MNSKLLKCIYIVAGINIIVISPDAFHLLNNESQPQSMPKVEYQREVGESEYLDNLTSDIEMFN